MMYKYISSVDNSLIKKVQKLKERKYRQEYGEYIIEGTRMVEEAVKFNAEIDCILVREGYAADALNIDEKNVYTLSDKVFKKISDVMTPQGILSLVYMRKSDLNDAACAKGPAVILDGVQDPGNIGTIIRTADALGASCIVSLKGTGDIYNSKTVRATMGSLFHIPVIATENVEEVYERFKKMNIKIVATSLSASKEPKDIDFKNTAVVFGNEGNGISKISKSYADYLVKIPMKGMAESLNVAVSAAIILYEAARQ